MYQAYWGLTQSPFRGQLDPRYFYLGAAQEEALARIQFLVDERRTLGFLLGVTGSGKSLLLETFARELSRVGRQKAVVNLAGLEAREFFWLVCCQLGVEAASTTSTFSLWRSLTDHLTANRYQQIATILLFDDADLARGEVIDQIARLAEFDTSCESRLSMVLAAQSAQGYKLGTRLWELADMRVDLECWEHDDTIAFIKKTLSTAGRSTPIFSEAGLARLHELSGGIPRRVKQLADLALLAGAAGNLSQIEGDTIDVVARELGATAAEPPLAQTTRR